jgi:argininosuccinate synthase
MQIKDIFYAEAINMNKKDIKKVVLAYSGGLDTSIIIPWLKENYNNCEVIAVSGNVGQADELEGLEEKAIKTGASKIYIEDLTDEFVDEYVIPTVKAGALYEEYMLGTSFARPVIAKRIAEIAKAEGADAICHGCTGKGNDQVRFELTIKAFLPDMPIIAPWREWDIKSREEEIEYAEAHNVPLKINRETNYSKDKNLWHLSHEGLDLEDAGNEPLYEKPGFLEMGVSPIDAPDTPTYITLDFEQGCPVALNDKKMSAKDIILELNKLGGANGIGLLDIVENRLVGMKCRGVYETPGGAILYAAHNYLETLTLDKMTMHKKQELGITFGELVYNGQWFTPLREAISAFVDKTQETVTGKVKLKLYKGNIIKAGAWSDYSLYSEEIATFGEDNVYNQADSAGFINLYGLPIKVQAQVKAKNNK